MIKVNDILLAEDLNVSTDCTKTDTCKRHARKYPKMKKKISTTFAHFTSAFSRGRETIAKHRRLLLEYRIQLVDLEINFFLFLFTWSQFMLLYRKRILLDGNRFIEAKIWTVTSSIYPTPWRIPLEIRRGKPLDDIQRTIAKTPQWILQRNYFLNRLNFNDIRKSSGKQRKKQPVNAIDESIEACAHKREIRGFSLLTFRLLDANQHRYCQPLTGASDICNINGTKHIARSCLLQRFRD